MFNVLYPILVMILVSFAAIGGALISYFTKLEMDTYQKVLNQGWIVLGLLLFVVVFAGGFIIPCPITFFVAVAGLVAFILFRNKKPIYRWAVLGGVLGFLFARNIEFAYLASSFFILFNFFYATVLNIPLILKKKKFIRTRLIEQLIFIVKAIAVYLIVRPFF